MIGTRVEFKTDRLNYLNWPIGLFVEIFKNVIFKSKGMFTLVLAID